MALSRRLALVTCGSLAEPAADERSTEPLLRERGFEVLHLPWDQTEVDWSELAAVVIRSTWDYSQRIEEFRAWLSQLEEAGVPIWNPVPLLRWNLDKRYLEDLEEAGIPIAPTGWVEQGGLVLLSQIFEFEGWREVVVKPTISAGAADTFSVTAAEARARDSEFRALIRGRDMMVQELLPEIRDQGEVSLCFLDGEYSHAVLKRPAEGDFRVQERLGGSVEAYEASADLVRQAEKVLAEVKSEWLYARVDGVVRKKKLILMELELLEPGLYLDHGEGAAERFVEALTARLG